MSPDTGATRPLTLTESSFPVGSKLPTGEIVVSHRVGMQLRAGHRALKQQRRRRQAKASRRANRPN